jgi:general secretion pathway protein D
MNKHTMITVLAAFLLSSCASYYWVGAGKGHIDVSRKADEKTSSAANAQGIALGTSGEQSEEPPPKVQYIPGNGRFVKPIQPREAPSDVTAGDVTLSFDNSDLREVVQVILGDLLGFNYVLEPGVQGGVTLETGRPLRRDMLLPTLETLLRMNNAALVANGDMFRVMPINKALKGNLVPQLGDSRRPLPRGYSVRIVPLQYIAAEEMGEILKPMAPEGSVIRVDRLRNLLVLAGTSPELGSLLDTIEVFDVDWIKGLSIGIFRLENTKLEDMTKQLDNLLAGKDQNPLSGLFRLVQVESTNSLMVLTHRESYLKEIGRWIERLDQAATDGEGSARLYVYRMKHGEAANVADLLQQLFADQKGASRAPARVAPGQQASRIQSTSKTKTKTAAKDTGANTASRTSTTTAANSDGKTAYDLGAGVSIVADTTNNSLLIRATPSDYRRINEALNQLDILPLQVLIEATIVEVSLSGELQYGLNWFFKTHHGGYSTEGSWNGNLAGDTSGLDKKLFPGFNWSLLRAADDIRAVLSAFAGDGLVNVLSSPSVMVLDNHTARIQVGDQVPVATSQQQGVDETARIVNNIEYRDTGVMLEVTPRVTPGGLVIMDVAQEVSTVATISASTLDSPTIQTRNITSSVAVKNDQAVVLGGLIDDRTSQNDGGVPGLYSLPGIGWAFGQKSRKADRKELVVVLTPRVITSDQDIDEVTEEFRGKLQGLREKF